MQRARERTVRKYKRRYLAETEAGVDNTVTAVKLRQGRQCPHQRGRVWAERQQ